MSREFDRLIEEEIRRRTQGPDAVGGVPVAQEAGIAGAFGRGLPYRQGINSLRPVDPSADTFRKRFEPFSSDPIGDKIIEQLNQQRRLPGTPVAPGYQERYGDPTKVISEADTGTKSDASSNAPAPMTAPKGFVFADEPPAPTQASVPPKGFVFADEPPPQPVEREPAFNAGSSRDPAEYPRWEKPSPPGITPSPAGLVKAAIQYGPTIAETAGGMVNRVADLAKKGFTEGTLPPNEMMELATMGTPAAPMGMSSKVISRLAQPPLERALMELGIHTVPTATKYGPTGESVAKLAAAVPVGGAPLRAAADATDKALLEAGKRSSAIPTGAAVGQNEAGAAVRQGVRDTIASANEVGAVLPRPSAIPVSAASDAVSSVFPAASIPNSFRTVMRQSNEDIIGTIVKTAAETKAGANINALGELRGAVPTAEWPKAQSAIITRLGKAGPAGEFTPAAFTENYNALSEAGKNIVFGGKADPLRRHLDSIAEVQKNAANWRKYSTSSVSLGAKLGAGSLFTGAAWAGGPLGFLALFMPVGTVSKIMARPTTAAPLADWSRAAERVFRSGGAPQAVAGFKMATTNLSNTIGIDIDPDAILKGPANEQPVAP
jgi:hypothetical protein